MATKQAPAKSASKAAPKKSAPAPAKKSATSSNTKSAATQTGKSNNTSKSSSKADNNQGKIKATSEAASGLRDLFEDSLKDIYWAEKALTKALPKMGKNATSEELVACINDHLAVTKEQVARLEQVFEILGKKAQAKKCDAMEGLIKEGEGIMEETEIGVVRDAGIIAASQKIEHYEIATYGTLVSFATILGETEAADLLGQTLAEEKDADATLSGVAESTINIAAADEDDEDDSEDEA